MTEATTETAPTPTEAGTSTEASSGTLLTSGAAEGTQQQQGETQQAQSTTEGEKPAEEAKQAESKPEGAPEKYKFSAPEGTDPAVLDAFSSAAKDANLTQEAAQKMLEKMAPTLAARQMEQVAAIQNEWQEAARSDKEFGGEKLQENLGVAKKALDAFDPVPKGEKTTPLRTLLETTKLGNNPEVIRLLVRAGKAISEDKFVSGSPGGSGSVDWADIMYPNTPK